MTVVNAGLLSQLVRQFPKLVLQRLVTKHQAERHAKGFSCWDQLVAMLFCHLARADSLREIEYGLKSCGRRIVHVGMKRPPARSTLSYANINRPAELFRDLFYATLGHLRGQCGLIPGRRGFEFTNKLLSVDSTVIPLSLEVLPWGAYSRAKGGLKVHVLLDHTDYLPRFVNITTERQHDLVFARGLKLPAGSIIVLDRGYMDLGLFHDWDKAGVFFVTRLKKGMPYRTRRRLPIAKGSAVLEDGLIKLHGDTAQQRYPQLIRRIVLEVPDGQGGVRRLVLLSNLLDMPAEVLAAIYKERWQIELFFKALKQNLTLKNFVGSMRNAIEIQIWTALIALLLLKWMQYLSRSRWSLSNLAAALRLHLFTHRALLDFLNSPWDPPPELAASAQLSLKLKQVGQPA